MQDADTNPNLNSDENLYKLYYRLELRDITSNKIYVLKVLSDTIFLKIYIINCGCKIIKITRLKRDAKRERKSILYSGTTV